MNILRQSSQPFHGPLPQRSSVKHVAEVLVVSRQTNEFFGLPTFTGPHELRQTSTIYFEYVNEVVCNRLAQRRHLRVKTWTRHVDLFSKDFIIVPINER